MGSKKSKNMVIKKNPHRFKITRYISDCKGSCRNKILIELWSRCVRAGKICTPANYAQVYRLFASVNPCFCYNMLMAAFKCAEKYMKNAGQECDGIRRVFLAYVRPVSASWELLKHHSQWEGCSWAGASLYGHHKLWIFPAQTRIAPISRSRSQDLKPTGNHFGWDAVPCSVSALPVHSPLDCLGLWMHAFMSKTDLFLLKWNMFTDYFWYHHTENKIMCALNPTQPMLTCPTALSLHPQSFWKAYVGHTWCWCKMKV